MGDLIEMATRQKQVLWMLLFGICANIAARILGMPILVIAVAVFQIYFVYKLAKAVGSMAILYIILLFIPILGLIGLFVLSDKATKALKAQGLSVGLMGVPTKEINRLKASA